MCLRMKILLNRKHLEIKMFREYKFLQNLSHHLILISKHWIHSVVNSRIGHWNAKKVIVTMWYSSALTEKIKQGI